jgi:hypothetical protein
MTHIDALLPLISSGIQQIQDAIPKKDKRILLSLAKQTSSGIFLTENQANLLTKIIKENLLAVLSVAPSANDALTCNTWSKVFREVKKIRKIYLSSENPGFFSIEFNYNTRLRDKINLINTTARGSILAVGSKYISPLTEDTIYLIVKTFLNDGFEIDEKIMDFYQEIENVKKNVKDPFTVFELENEKMKNFIVVDVGMIDLENNVLLQDRKIRYQYRNDQKTPGNTLATKIANRDNRKVFINADITSFSQLLASLKELNRLPAMLVFDGHQSSKDKKSLELLKNAVTELGLTEDIGIYFRYEKGTDVDHFNQEISILGYNKNLTPNTLLAGISNSKLPKFMIKDQWKPETVITFTNSFRSNKTFVYCSDVDLVVYYGTSMPLDGEVNAIV